VGSALVSVLAVAAVCYVAVAGLLYVFQPHFIYFPGPPPQRSPAAIGLAFEELWLEPAPDARVHAWWVPAGDQAPVLLFMHGNAGSIGDRLESLRLFHELGLSVLIFDYRGYGASSGVPGEQATIEDARAAWRYLRRERGVPAGRIVLFGRSLGAAVAIALASEVEAGALIVESAFTSMGAIAARHYPWLPARWLVRVHYPNLERIGAASMPVLVVHSREDRLIPFEMGRRLHEAARAPKAFLEITGGHNDGFLVSGARYREGLAEFLAEHLRAPAGAAN